MPTIHRSTLALSLLLLSAAPLGCDLDDADLADFDGADPNIDLVTLGTAEPVDHEPPATTSPDEIDVDLGLEFRDYGQRPIIMVDCTPGPQCYGMWQFSIAWSPIYPYESVAQLPNVNPSTIWPCDPTPDVDACKVVDQQGHVGCFRWVYNDAWAVAVAPVCVTGSWSNWIDVGNEMEAKVYYYYNPY